MRRSHLHPGRCRAVHARPRLRQDPPRIRRQTRQEDQRPPAARSPYHPGPVRGRLPDALAVARRRPHRPPLHPGPLPHLRTALPDPRARRQEAQPAHRQGRPRLARSTCRCCWQYLSPLTIVYLHALLPGLQQAVREDDLTRNAARNSRLHALVVLALRTGMRRGRTRRPAPDGCGPGRRHSDHPPDLPVHPRRSRARARPQDRQARTPSALPSSCVDALTEHRERQEHERQAVPGPGSCSPPAMAE